MTQSTIPAHVPAELVWDHKLNDFTFEGDDPFIAAGRLHEGPGIIWSTEASLGQASWVFTRYDIIRDAFADYELFSSTRDSSTGEVLKDTVRMIPVEVDPPEHSHYRRLLNPFFGPKKINDYSDMVQGTCNRLIDAIKNPARCEFISEFADVFPNSIFLSLMGMPQEKLPQFLEWDRQLLRSGDQADFESAQQASKMIFGYLHSFLAEQRDNPEQQTPFVKGLLEGTIEGRPLTDQEILGTWFLFYVAGLDTVYATLGWVMRHLAKDTALQDHLRANPQDIPKAVDEFTRAYAVPAPHRRVAKDCEFYGVKLKENDVVLLPTYLAARDPYAYENPHTIDINRQARSVTFANGPHTCLGVHLAKREIRVVLETFLARFKSIRLPEGGAYQYHTGGVLGVDKLDLILEV